MVEINWYSHRTARDISHKGNVFLSLLTVQQTWVSIKYLSISTPPNSSPEVISDVTTGKQKGQEGLIPSVLHHPSRMTPELQVQVTADLAALKCMNSANTHLGQTMDEMFKTLTH